MEKPLVVLHLLLSLSLSFSLLLSLSSDQKEASLMLYQALVIIYNTLIELVNVLFCQIYFQRHLKFGGRKEEHVSRKLASSHYYLLTSILAESLHCRF